MVRVRQRTPKGRVQQAGVRDLAGDRERLHADRGGLAAGYVNAPIPVMSRPTISACIVAVPS
jgi:hypothetical protein